MGAISNRLSYEEILPDRIRVKGLRSEKILRGITKLTLEKRRTETGRHTRTYVNLIITYGEGEYKIGEIGTINRYDLFLEELSKNFMVPIWEGGRKYEKGEHIS